MKLFIKKNKLEHDGNILLDSFSDEFPLDTQTLSKLVDPKNPDLLREFGGIQGLSKSLRTDYQQGIPLEHNDIESHRLLKYGNNVLPPAPQKSLLTIIYEASKDQVLIILIISAAISIVLGALKWTAQDTRYDWIQGVAILIAVVIVVTVTTGNNYQKQKQFQKLDQKKGDRVVKVVRGGEQCQISIFDVKVGDVIILETGDIVCADGIYLDGFSIKCDESSFTGEPDAIKKGHLNDNLDPFFLSGSQVLEGFGKMLVIAVGKNSFHGRIMMSLNVQDEQTPLQEKLEVLANNIGKFGLYSAVLLLVIVIPKYLIIHRNSLTSSAVSVIVRYIVNAISIVVVAVPEGLPLAVTLALAFGTMKMFKKNNLVRHLAACETMADVTNICSDKTGTLTLNQMTVVTGWFCGRTYLENEFFRAEQELQGFVHEVICSGIAVNTTAFEGSNAKGRTEFIGSPTECALLIWARKLGSDFEHVRKTTHIKQLYPFSSERKRMSVLISLEDNNTILLGTNTNSGAKKTSSTRSRLYCKGASEIVLGMCDRYLGSDGSVYPLTDKIREGVSDSINIFASDALRTIALAYNDFEDERNWENPPEDNLILIGITGIRDPVRPEVPKAVEDCKRAGILVRMVTGDNIVTAKNIAQKCGILTEGGIALEGPQFRELSEKEMDAILPNLQVLARSSPLDKQLLVGRLQKLGEVVAVTGDGTNDAPALKLANIGFSMGISGTEVAIAASNVVLLDDNFASIIISVLWGRNIYDGIRKFLQFQLTVNVVAVVVAFVGSITSDSTSPLTAIELLWINLLMDSFAALALASEKPTPRLLDRPPNHPQESLISRLMWRNIAVQAIWQILVCFIVLYKGDKIWPVVLGSLEHYTLLFNIFVFMQLFNEINARELQNDLNSFRNLQKNKVFFVIMVISVIIQVVFVEFGGQYTGCVPLKVQYWFESVLIGAFSLVIGVLMRFIPIKEKEYPPRITFVKSDDNNVILPGSNGEYNRIEEDSIEAQKRLEKSALITEAEEIVSENNHRVSMHEEDITDVVPL